MTILEIIFEIGFWALILILIAPIVAIAINEIKKLLPINVTRFK